MSLDPRVARDWVHVAGPVPRPADEVWAVLRDFCGLWHPAMARVWPEAGGQVRAFEAGGVTYRERLVYVSDSDRVLGYRHVAGIAGVDSYDARVSVVPDGAGCRVIWTAEVVAVAPRAAEVAAGTRAIFEAGIAALAGAVVPVVAEAVPAAVAIVERVVGEGPRLALSVTPGQGGPLCLFLHGIGGGRGNWRGQLAAAWLRWALGWCLGEGWCPSCPPCRLQLRCARRLDAVDEEPPLRRTLEAYCGIAWRRDQARRGCHHARRA